MSEAGIGILLATDLNGGEVVGLNFKLPESDAAWDVQAVVRYRRGYHYGFELLSLKPKLKKILINYLSGLKPLE